MTDFVEDCKQRVARGEKLSDVDRELAINLVMIDGLSKMYRGAPIKKELQDNYFGSLPPRINMDPMGDFKYIQQRFGSMTPKEAAETGFFGEGATEQDVKRTMSEISATISGKPQRKTWYSRLITALTGKR